ncbi:hypothetical protein ACFLQ3_00750 [Bacteroidota bacterium]
MKLKSHIEIVKPSIILLGFIAIVSQIILLREFLTLFSGNELVIGIILANWMLLTGFGAYLGRFFINEKYRTQRIIILLGSLAFIPFLSVLILHILWYAFFPPGIMAGMFHVFYYSMVILSPFCIVAGILFTLLSKEESLICKKNKIGDVYAWESVGSLVGGVVLNLIFIWFLSTFQSLFLILLLVVSFVIVLSFNNHYYLISGVFIFFALGFTFLFLSNDLDRLIREKAFPGQELTYTKDSPHGVFIITQQNGQTNYYENNILMSSTGDVISKEESAHLAMIQHLKPKKVLVLSGIVSGLMEEIVKYPVESIDYIDINPEIINISQNYLNTDSFKTLDLIQKDALRYLRTNSKKYDVVLINLPKPSTIQLNRYYTREFYQLLKKHLTDNSVISFSLPSSANYMNDEAKRLLSIIYSTVKSEFKNVLILPLGEDFIIASNASLTTNIAQNIEEKNIQTEYLNSFYIDDELLNLRSNEIINQLDVDVPLNKDFSPVFYQSQIKLWMSQFNIKYWIPSILIILFSGFFFIRAGIVYKGVFAAGFAGTSIEIVLLLVFQVIFGYVYVATGIFIMIFMGGLALGSYYIPKLFINIDNSLFRKLQICIVLFSILLPILFLLIKNIRVHDSVLFIVFAILLLIISILTGAIFSVASKIVKHDYAKVASSAYGLDLLGAATGALLITIYLIPILGFSWSIIVIGVFNLFVISFK